MWTATSCRTTCSNPTRLEELDLTDYPLGGSRWPGRHANWITRIEQLAAAGVAKIWMTLERGDRQARRPALDRGCGAREVRLASGPPYTPAGRSSCVRIRAHRKAFGVSHAQASERELPEFERRLRRLGVDIKPPRPRVDGEGVSLYFYDYHLYELHTGTLEQRLERYRGAV